MYVFSRVLLSSFFLSFLFLSCLWNSIRFNPPPPPTPTPTYLHSLLSVKKSSSALSLPPPSLCLAPLHLAFLQIFCQLQRGMREVNENLSAHQLLQVIGRGWRGSSFLTELKSWVSNAMCITSGRTWNWTERVSCLTCTQLSTFPVIPRRLRSHAVRILVAL